MKKELTQYISNIENTQKREDSKTLLKLFEVDSGFKPYLTGSIVGFGKYHYRYESGREGDAIVTGFSARKQNIAIYIMSGFSAYGENLKSLGKHKIGKSCLYINKLADIDIKELRKIIKSSVKYMQKKYACTNA